MRTLLFLFKLFFVKIPLYSLWMLLTLTWVVPFFVWAFSGTMIPWMKLSDKIYEL